MPSPVPRLRTWGSFLERPSGWKEGDEFFVLSFKLYVENSFVHNFHLKTSVCKQDIDEAFPCFAVSCLQVFRKFSMLEGDECAFFFLYGENSSVHKVHLECM